MAAAAGAAASINVTQADQADRLEQAVVHLIGTLPVQFPNVSQAQIAQPMDQSGISSGPPQPPADPAQQPVASAPIQVEPMLQAVAHIAPLQQPAVQAALPMEEGEPPQAPIVVDPDVIVMGTPASTSPGSDLEEGEVRDDGQISILALETSPMTKRPSKPPVLVAGKP